MQTPIGKKAEHICPNVTERNNVTVHRSSAEFANSQSSLTTQPSLSDIVCSLVLPNLELPIFTGEQTGPLGPDSGGSISNTSIHSQCVDDLSQDLHTAGRRDVRYGVACSLEGKADKAEISNLVTLIEGHYGTGLPCRKTNCKLLSSWAPGICSVRMSHVSPLCDLLRSVAPIFPQVSVSLQEFCRHSLGWKDEILENSSKRWRYWLGNLFILIELRIARFVRPADLVSITPSGLHRFSGAFETGCGFACHARRQLEIRGFRWSLVRYNLRVAFVNTIFVSRLRLTVAYLPSLQYRSKWFYEICSCKPGDALIIASDVFSWAHWPLGRVAALHPGADGVVRRLTIKAMIGGVLWDIRKICLLEGLEGHGSDANGQSTCD